MNTLTYSQESRLSRALQHLDLFWADYCDAADLPKLKIEDAAWDNELFTEQRLIAAMVDQIKGLACPKDYYTGDATRLAARLADDLALT